VIDIKELTLRRGPKILLKETNFTVHESERVGLIGPNGAGKSSLFALISGQLEADKGQVFIPTHWRIAQVKQHINERERKAIDFVIDGDTHLRRLQEKRAQTQLKDGMQIAQLETDLAEAGAWSAQARAEQLLEGLGFYQNQWNKPIGSFSGGWQMRIALAQALMTPSDLLLLDEPTNHLDLDAMLWLERWLQSYQGTVLIISHDADFLDAICTSIIHFEGLELVKYRGNFSQFQQQYAEKARQAEAAQNKQQKRIAHLQKFIDRFRAQASKAKQAQSRLKAIERMQTLAPLAQEQSIQIHLPQPGFMPDPLLRINQATLGYQENNQEKVILDHVNVSLRAGSRIGVLGMNGAGKSTLIKSLAAHLPLLSGEHIAARQLKIGYFAQHQLEMLDAQASSLQHLQRIAPEATEQQLRSYLGRFGFSEEKATDTITYFSGGEKARLALALIV